MKQKGGVIPIAAIIPGFKVKKWMKKKNKRKGQKGRGLKRYYHARR